MKNKIGQFILISFVLAVLLTQFNNCGSYAPTSVDGIDSLSCTTANCVTLTPGDLKITPHVFNGQYDVTSVISSFDIGGDCNEGGYLNNIVHWDLLLNGVVVRSSSNPDVAGGSSNAQSTCINGRFMVYVNLAAINSDPVDRTGLNTGNGVRSAYNLRIEIYGETIINGNGVPSVMSSSLVPLAAI